MVTGRQGLRELGPARSRAGLWAQSPAHLELVGGVEGDLTNFGEAVSVTHGVAQCQLRELEQGSLRRVSDHDALGTGSRVSTVKVCVNQAPDVTLWDRSLTLGTGTASWPDLKAARLHRVSTRHSARHVSEDWSKVCPEDQMSGARTWWERISQTRVKAFLMHSGRTQAPPQSWVLPHFLFVSQDSFL